MSVASIDIDQQMPGEIPLAQSQPQHSNSQENPPHIKGNENFFQQMHLLVEQIADNPVQHLNMYEKQALLYREDLNKCLEIYNSYAGQHDDYYRTSIEEFVACQNVMNINKLGAKDNWNLIRSSCQDSFLLGVGIYISDEIARKTSNLQRSQQWKTIIFVASIWILILLVKLCYPCISPKRSLICRLLRKTPKGLKDELQKFKNIYLLRNFTLNLRTKLSDQVQQFIEKLQNNEHAQQQIEDISANDQRYRIILIKIYQKCSQLDDFQRALSEYYEFKLLDALAQLCLY